MTDAGSPEVAAAVLQPQPAPRTKMSAWSVRRFVRVGRGAALLLFGLLLPILLLSSAYQGIGKLDDLVAPGADLASIAKSMPTPMQQYESPNDYAMLLSTYLEASNQRVMLNKHRMKIAVINIGFAVICIGLLLLVLGIDAGGIEVSGSAKDVAIVNLKVASSGVAVFVLGACMSAAGGLLPNEYKTVSIPGFAQKPSADEPKASAATLQAKLAELFTICERDTVTPIDRQSCYLNAALMLGK